MARYMVIEFDDDNQADALRAKIDIATKSGKGFRVVGLFARPRNTCKCYKEMKDYKVWGKEIVRGAKFGWWVCGDCRKALTRDHQLNNLMGKDDIIDMSTFMGNGPSTSSEPRNALRVPYRFLLSTLNINVMPAKVLDRA